MGSSAEMKGKNVTVDETETYFTKKLTALVVDDSKMHRMIHKKLLATLGVESQEAENGKEAVDICLSGEAFNLILMDYDMPVMDGREATKLLRENGVNTMIMGITARSREWEREEFMAAENGKEAVDICLSGKAFNLIHMEYDMPVMLEQSEKQ